MEQSKLGSFIESLFNLFIGSIVALLSQLVIFPMYDMNPTLDTNLAITGWFTVVSIIRSYTIRRYFNAIIQSRLGSFSEALVNLAIGAIVSFSSQLVILPMHDLNPTLETNLAITIWFTGVGVIRSYTVRRFVNKRMKVAAFRLAQMHTG